MRSKKFNEVRPYTYWIKHLETGIKYVGLRYHNIKFNRTPLQDFGVHYFTTGKLKEEFRENQNNFKTRLLCTYDTVDEAVNHELELTSKAKDNKRYANIASYPHIPATLEVRKKISEKKRGKKRKPFSEEWLINLSKSQKGRKHSEESNIKRAKSLIGKKHPENRVRKMAEAKKGYIASEETKRKLSKALKGKKQSQEHIKKRFESKKGYIVSEETRRKISEANKGKKRKPFTVEHKKNMSEGQKGRKLSEESRRKISESLKRYKAQATLSGQSS